MTIGDLLAEIDVPVNAPPHSCLHRSARYVSNPKKIEERAAFRHEFVLRVPFAQKRKIAEPCSLEVQVWRRAKRSADTTNLLKEIEDACVDAHILLDDRFVKETHVKVWAQGPAIVPRIRVFVRRAGGDWAGWSR